MARRRRWYLAVEREHVDREQPRLPDALGVVGRAAAAAAATAAATAAALGRVTSSGGLDQVDVPPDAVAERRDVLEQRFRVALARVLARGTPPSHTHAHPDRPTPREPDAPTHRYVKAHQHMCVCVRFLRACLVVGIHIHIRACVCVCVRCVRACVLRRSLPCRGRRVCREAAAAGDAGRSATVVPRPRVAPSPALPARRTPRRPTRPVALRRPRRGARRRRAGRGWVGRARACGIGAGAVGCVMIARKIETRTPISPDVRHPLCAGPSVTQATAGVPCDRDRAVGAEDIASKRETVDDVRNGWHGTDPRPRKTLVQQGPDQTR